MNIGNASSPPPAPATTGCWRFDGAETQLALRQAVLAPLDELGVISVGGEDAGGFLHGQLTNDVEHLGDGRLALNGYCTAKGRLLATFRVWRDEQAIHLLLPSELLPAIARRLSMFVLRARVKLADTSAAWRPSALFGAGAQATLRSLGCPLPAAVGDCVPFAGLRIARLHVSPRLPERFLVLAPAAASLPAGLAQLPAAGGGAFWWSEIDAGVPTVFASTQEKFVPQMINFEVLGGVNFKKGCYPGQEIVARSQYLGKLKRRMQRAQVDHADVAIAGDVYHSGEQQPVGTIVLAAASPHGGTDLLFEAPIDRLQSGSLHLASPTGPALALRGLPYELFDPTA